MSLDITAFRSVQGERLVLNNPIQTATGAIKAQLPFLDRVVNFFKSGEDKYGTVQQRQENREFKTTFLTALVKSEGWEIANKAVKAAGLKPGWALSGKPMDEKTVQLVLDKAQHYRQKAVEITQHNMEYFLQFNGTPGFRDSFQNTPSGLPGSDVDNPALQALFSREVKLHPDFAKRPFGPGDLQGIAHNTILKFEAMKQSQFREQYPGLSHYVQQGHGGVPREDSRSFFGELVPQLSTSTSQGHPLSGEPVKFRGVAQEALVAIWKNQTLLSRMEYEPEGWKELGDDLLGAHDRLLELETQLGALGGVDLPGTPEGQDLMAGLAQELRHQRDLLLAKAGFLDDVMQNDPLGQKMVDYSNLLWAQAAGKIFDEAIGMLTDPGAIDRLQKAKTHFIDMQQEIYDTSKPGPRTIEPGTVEKALHPATLGKTTAKEYLETFLRQAGVPKETIKELTSSDNLGRARRQALNENQDWAPIRREMVVHRDGVTRTYESRITPGSSISPRFERLYGGPGTGISSATKDDLVHARNLKVSELVRKDPGGQEHSKVKLIGHGVLDMWDIDDPQQRHDANVSGAHEVLEAAITVNDRIRTEALNRVQNGNPTPIKITHVSVNLITPAGWRELPGMVKTDTFHDYQEKTYTQEQFRAFHENTTEGTGGPVIFHLDDDRPPGLGIVNQGQDTQIEVDVDVIAFSFGINPIATGKMPDFMGGWSQIYDHNRGMMEKFVGDLGSGEFGAFGARPGGFIGEVLDHLDMTNPDHRELAGRIQEQTDLVRSMFTHEDFKRGNGDPAKMGRHILALQGLAEEALELAGVNDLGATMSKGCKSDKDRGGVTDTELKHQLITEDMGGQILPDMQLEGDDQNNYYVVSSGSGQLENQLLNTGLPGSKEAGKLKERIPSPTVRQYLSGLGSFSSE